MLIRTRVALILVGTILLSMIPTALIVYQKTKDEVFSVRLPRLLFSVDQTAQVIPERIAANQSTLIALAPKLEEALAAPPTAAELARFDAMIHRDSDGIWRNLKPPFNGKKEAGIQLLAQTISDEEKVRHLRIKSYIDQFGVGQLGNLWYINPQNGGVFFDSVFPNYIYGSDPEYDYTDPAWTRSELAAMGVQKRRVIISEPLFEPVTKQWIVSLLCPIFVNGKWMGTIGHDILLLQILDHYIDSWQSAINSKHILFDQNNQLILGDFWQNELRLGQEYRQDVLKKHNEIIKTLLQAPLANKPQLIFERAEIADKDYLIIGIQIEPMGWRFFEAVPWDVLFGSIVRTFKLLGLVTVLILLFSGGTIYLFADYAIAKRLRLLKHLVQSYEVGDKTPPQLLELEDQEDEIGSIAGAYDALLQRLATQQTLHRQLELGLRVSEERYALAVAGADIGIWDYNVITQQFFCTPRMFTMLGYPPRTHCSLDEWIPLTHRDDRDEMMVRFKACRLGQADDYEFQVRFLHADGSWRWILSRGRLNLDVEENVAHFIGSHKDVSLLVERHNLLQSREQEIRTILDAVPDALFIFNSESGELLEVNQQMWELYLIPEELRQLDQLLNHSSALFELIWQRLRQVKTGESGRFIERMSRHDQSLFWGELSLNRIEIKGLEYVIVAVRNIDERMQAKERLRLAASVFSNAAEGILLLDAAGDVIDVNQTFTTMTGVTPEMIVGGNVHDYQQQNYAPELYHAIWSSMNKQGYWSGEVCDRSGVGKETISLLSMHQNRAPSGELLGYTLFFSDISELKSYQQQLERRAHYDTLTQLPNRVLFSDRLHKAMQRAERHNDLLALLYLDLDGFKAVNDTYGHDAGDYLLITIAKRMQAALRAEDTLARIGGDEFVAILHDVEDAEVCAIFVQRMLSAAAEEVYYQGNSLRVSASIGVALYPESGVFGMADIDGEQLMRHADQAMYQAKLSGKNCYRLFKPASATLNDEEARS